MGAGSGDSSCSRDTRVLLLRHRAAERWTYGGLIYTDSLVRLIQQPPLAARVEELVFEEQPCWIKNQLRKSAAILRSLLSPLPAKVERFRGRRYRRRLRDRLSDVGADLVLVNGPDMLWCLPLLVGKVPVVYVAHNLEAALFAQQIARQGSQLILRPLFLRRDAAKLATLERQALRVSSGVIAISPTVAEGLASIAAETPVLCVPPTFSPPRWQPSPLEGGVEHAGHRIRLGFVGNLGWWANRVSLEWFLTDVWPNLDNAYELHVFGAGSERLVARPGIVRHGYVADLAEVWQTSHLLVQPMIVGAGVNIKVAEAVFHRRPMIATSLALAGCALAPDPAILVADGAAAWVSLLRSEQPIRLVGAWVREANAERFAQGAHARRLGAFLSGLIGADPYP